MRSSKRPSSEFDSGSTSSSSDFVILSTSERSDGSIVFRFGHAKDGETTVASADVVKADNAATDGSITEHGKQSDESMGPDSSLEQVKSHSKRRGRRQSAQVNREVSSVRDGDNNEQFHYRAEPDAAEDQVKSRTKRRGRRNSAKLTKEATSVLDRERGEEDSVIDSTSELSESVEEAALDTKISDLSRSEVSTGEVSLDYAIDVVETRNTGSEVDVVPNEEIRNDVEENSASIGENGVLDVADNFAPRASSEESSHAEVASLTTSCEDNGDLVGVTNASTMIQAETSLCQEIHTITSDADVESDKTGTAIALGYNVSSESSEEERASKTNRSNAAGVSISEVVEFHSIKETPSREETSTAGFVLSFGAASLPHPSKGVEDSYFFASQSWLGVADGVGQWSLEGSSAALYARELMDNCERIVADFKGIQMKEPEEVLIRSVAEAQSPGFLRFPLYHFE